TELFGTVIPSKIFETMAMARPIIMGVKGEARDIVLRAGAGISMEPESASSLLEAIEQLASDDIVRRKMGDSARQFVIEHFSRDHMAQSYLRLMTDLVESAGVRTPNDDRECCDRFSTRKSVECVTEAAIGGSQSAP
ncbi:MAG: hypothetical protein KF861_22090, partial [Planctomycetaceae bacterium]|nr:hypothetical protein [Planctomycetaceae bacterium]